MECLLEASTNIFARDKNSFSALGYALLNGNVDIVKVVANSELIQAPYKTASLLSHQYFHIHRHLLDKHAPVHERKTPHHVNKAFISSEILAAKRRKCKLKREWRRDNSAIYHSRYRADVNHFNCLLECAKTKYYSNMVRENEDNPKALWNSIKSSIDRQNLCFQIILPSIV